MIHRTCRRLLRSLSTRARVDTCISVHPANSASSMENAISKFGLLQSNMPEADNCNVSLDELHMQDTLAIAEIYPRPAFSICCR